MRLSTTKFTTLLLALTLNANAQGLFSFFKDQESCPITEEHLSILDIPKEFKSLADFKGMSDKDAKSHYKKIVGDKSPEEFLEIYKELTLKKLGENAIHEKITIPNKKYYFEVIYDKNELEEDSDKISDLTQRSYTKHMWVKKDEHGHILELGSSEIKSSSEEQEVIYFAGPLKNHAYAENW